MNEAYILRELKSNAAVFNQLLRDQTAEQFMWKQQPDKWCLLEIVCHFYDEELDDFKARVKHTFETPELPLPKTDPVGWIKSQEYIKQDYSAMLDAFLTERKNTIEWIQGIKNPLWKNVHNHPKVGPINAELFFVNWLAHDLLHIRQIIKLKYDYLKATTAINLDYAGEW